MGSLLWTFLAVPVPSCLRGSDAPAARAVPDEEDPRRFLCFLQVPTITNMDVFDPCLVLKSGGLGVPMNVRVT